MCVCDVADLPRLAEPVCGLEVVVDDVDAVMLDDDEALSVGVQLLVVVVDVRAPLQEERVQLVDPAHTTAQCFMH